MGILTLCALIVNNQDSTKVRGDVCHIQLKQRFEGSAGCRKELPGAYEGAISGALLGGSWWAWFWRK